jgi:hypothetical protein
VKQPTDGNSRMCCKAEHITHNVAGCTTIAPSSYTNRHIKVGGYIHWTVCKDMGLQVTDRDCEHVPERVITVNGTAIMWDVPVILDRTVTTNRPDIVLHVLAY